MRLLADENVPAPSVRHLRDAGYDVEFVLESSPGIDDADVIARARTLGRALLTLDSDIGERIFHLGDAPPPAVLYLRGVESDPLAVAMVVVHLFAGGRAPAPGEFVTVHGDRMRRRALPR